MLAGSRYHDAVSAGVATNGQRLPPAAWLLLPALALALNWPYLGAGFADR